MNTRHATIDRHSHATHTTGTPGTIENDLLTRALDVLALWQERNRMRHSLAKMDNRLLRDIGLTRDDVRLELRKPFWRE
jgi:uncharacterized protein YjiS (DUF1127 family)